MRGRNLIILVIAVVIALIAVFLTNSYFGGVEEQQKRVAEQQKLARIVVASQELTFGVPLSQQNLRLANWPANSVPAGAFTTVEAAMNNNRVALRPIVVGEPVLASKVSGADGRATLSANLPLGKVAFTVPINSVSGVGGFVRPGDIVDVLLTRPIPGTGSAGNDKMTDIVLTAVPVLGIDLVSDESQTKPQDGKTATLEVDTIGAQKLALSVQLGSISLALRNVADQVAGPRQTILPRYLTTGNFRIAARDGAPVPPAMAAAAAVRAMPLPGRLNLPPPRPSGPTMVIVRGGGQSQEYEVQHGW